MPIPAVSDVTILRGEELVELPSVLECLQFFWGRFASPDLDEFKRRIENSDGHIIAAYDNGKFAGTLEALRIDTECDPLNVPRDFDTLTGSGAWNTQKKDGDTVMLVDLTVPREYQGKGITEKLIDYSLGMPGIKYTYSPYSVGFPYAKSLHEKKGAIHVRTLQNARPGYCAKWFKGSAVTLIPAPDVALMFYEGR